MLNLDCVNDVMCYLNENLASTAKPNGKLHGFKAKDILPELPNAYDETEFHIVVDWLLKSGLVTKANPENETAPRVTILKGITPAGYDFLAAAKDPSMWEKLKGKLTLDNTLTGLSISQILVELLGK